MRWPWQRRETDAFGRPAERARPVRPRFPDPVEEGREPDADSLDLVPVRRGFDGGPLRQSGPQSGPDGSSGISP